MANDLDAVRRLGPVLMDSYFVVDHERRISEFNKPLVDLLQLRPSERRNLPGTHCYDLLKLEICQDRCIALECLKKNAPVHMQEISGTTRDGRKVLFTLSAVPLRDDSGAVTGVLVTQRETSDERRLKDRFLEEQSNHQREREALLRIIKDRDQEIQKLQTKLRTR